MKVKLVRGLRYAELGAVPCQPWNEFHRHVGFLCDPMPSLGRLRITEDNDFINFGSRMDTNIIKS